MASLRGLGLLDTPSEERFDRITRLLAVVLDVPIALVSLVDTDRQFFKSRVGLGVDQTGRDVAFCAHAINEAAATPFVVEDTLEDERFAENPLVVDAPNIRFYAGQVVHDANGLPMGTLCAIDRRPRKLDATQRIVLHDLAMLVEAELQRLDDKVLQRELDDVSKRNNLILSTLNEGLVFQEADGRIVTWNPAAERVLGLSSDQLGGRTSIDPRWGSVHEDGSPWPGETHPAMVSLATGKPVNDAIMGVDHPGKGRVWLRVNAQPILDADGRATSVLSAFTDITAEHNLAEEQRRSNFLYRNATDIVSVVDRYGHGLYRSPSFERVLGYPPGWRHPDDLWGIVHPDEIDAVKSHFQWLLTQERCDRPMVARFRAADGTWKALESVTVNLLHEPLVGGIVFTMRDVTERVRKTKELLHSASHDELTDLPNRRKLASRITSALERNAAAGRRVGLCFVDLDGFKLVNDTYGHAAGDDLLVAVSDRIRKMLRKGDHAARVGGDEFVILLNGVDSESEALQRAEQLRASIVLSVVPGVPMDAHDASIGVAVSGPGDTYSTLLQRADTALYAAKALRGRVELASSIGAARGGIS